MWIILGVLLSLSAWALEPFESIKNVKIIRVLPNNVVLLNRGMEDGILRNDRAKLSNDTVGYASRAICIRASADLSYWRIYRIPNTEAFSQDYTYTISGMADREIPFPESQIRDARQEIAELDNKKTDPGPNPFEVKRDLPEHLTERDLIKAETPEKRKLFIEKALNQDRLKKDLSDYQFSLYASPFTKQSINQGESYTYGFRGGNIGSKYRLLTQFEQQQTKLKDPVTKDTISTRSTYGNLQFVVSRLSNSFSSLSLINYRSQRFSAVATPKAQWQVGVIGFTWHIYESKTWEYFDLSYIPLYDTRTTEILQPDGSVKLNKTSGIRHGFRLATRTKINERIAFENLLWVKPYQDPSSWRVDGGNLNLSNDLKIVISLTNNLFMDYNFIFQQDKLWKTLSNLPMTNTINSLNFRYDFNL